jgi:hypothetical protein
MSVDYYMSVKFFMSVIYCAPHLGSASKYNALQTVSNAQRSWSMNMLSEGGGGRGGFLFSKFSTFEFV